MANLASVIVDTSVLAVPPIDCARDDALQYVDNAT